MLISVILTLALSSVAEGQAPHGSDRRAQAEQLARAGSHRAALERFQALAAENPDDVELRVWIGRLHEWMGRYNQAIPVYQAVLATQPQHVEALTGLGTSLVAVERLTEAAEALNRAEKLAPERPAVLAAQGRLHATAGRMRLGMAYYERALVLEPTSDRVRQEYEDVRAEWAHRVEVGYAFEHFNTDISDPQTVFGSVNARASDALRVMGTVQYHRKFSRDEARGGGGIEWAAHRKLRIHGGALFGGDAQVFPQVDGYGGLAYKYGRATWSFDLRIADFDRVRVNVGGGGLRIALPRHGALWAKYYRFETDYQAASSDVVQSWVVGGSGHLSPHVTAGVEYTRGPDHLQMLTIDRTGAFEANTISGFASIRVAPLLSLGARYDYQTRPAVVGEEPRVHRLTARLIQGF